MADPAADPGKRVFLFEEFEGLVVPAFIDQRDISLDADMGWASCLAGGGAALIDTVSTGNCLRILFESGSAKVEIFIVFIGNGNRASLGALTTACALGKVYVTRSLMYFCGKISGLAFETE